MSTLAEIVDRLEDGARYNGWANFPKYRMSLYYRVTSRVIEGKRLDTLDLATVEVDEEFRGQGLFSQFLSDVEEIAKEYQRTIFVESILNPRLYGFLTRKGYSPAGDMCVSK